MAVRACAKNVIADASARYKPPSRGTSPLARRQTSVAEDRRSISHARIDPLGGELIGLLLNRCTELVLVFTERNGSALGRDPFLDVGDYESSARNVSLEYGRHLAPIRLFLPQR
jgi:hypothetical protein